MFKKIIFIFLIITHFIYSQHTVQGELQPPENYPWMILYQLHGTKQNYVAYDSIKNGKFSIAIAKGRPAGIYRLVYDIKNQLFVDFIYENEDVKLIFNPENPNQNIHFLVSDENKLYQKYLQESQPIQKQMDSLQVLYFKTTDRKKQESISIAYQKNYLILTGLQNKFDSSSTGRLSNHFIKASTRYNSKTLIINSDAYLSSVKKHFFDYIDFNDPNLSNSTFINDKINDFIFYLNTSDDKKTQTQLYKSAIAIVLDKIKSNQRLSKDIQEGLIYAFTKQENIVIVNYLLNYYLQLPKELQNASFIDDIRGQLKTAIGMIVPNIIWSRQGINYNLHGLSGYQYYIVVFWSSTCSHCLKEMPIFYDFIKDKKEVKVIAVGLENDMSKSGWENQINNYRNFINVYGENKWKNKFARSYGVNATPSFFILDSKKKVLAKPDDVEEMKDYFAKIK